MKKIVVIGSGTWGTALAQVLADNGQSVIVYGNVKEQVDDINKNHQNSFYFGKDVFINENVKATTDLKKALKGRSIIILSVPTKAMRSVLNDIVPLLTKKMIFVNTAKGFDPDTDERITDLIREVVPEEKRRPLVSLIGPSHAEEVIIRHLTLVTSTSKSVATAKIIQNLFSNSYFRVYTQTDEVGAELSVAFKNAIALASGMIAGLDLGDNARAALVTRGLSELVRFGSYFGGKKSTFLGLAGIGDLMVTCYSHHSRNFQAGYEIGKEDGVEVFYQTNTKTVEGVRTVKVVHEICQKINLQLPIIEELYKVLYEGEKPSVAVNNLMIRPLKPEII